ncbi:SHOCT domain-containing protein [uncultured Ilumatobacter sp.]|uniref:SHOCT domain-containing protein n=1 Tax=uncultured Ilumatobacter sp. TaxID=879968 RepID=UPI00374FD1A9
MGRTAVVAGTASAVAGGVSARQTKKFNEGQQQAAAAQQSAYDQGLADSQAAAAAAAAAAPPAPVAAAPDLMAQLTQLGQLHDQGVLTDAEFAAQKAKLLG